MCRHRKEYIRVISTLISITLISGTRMASQYFQLSASDTKRLIKSHHYLLSTPNVVSLSYHDEKKDGKTTGQKALHVGMIKKLKPEDIVKPDIVLPKFVAFETEDKKKVEIRVRIIEEGEIEAL